MRRRCTQNGTSRASEYIIIAIVAARSRERRKRFYLYFPFRPARLRDVRSFSIALKPLEQTVVTLLDLGPLDPRQGDRVGTGREQELQVRDRETTEKKTRKKLAGLAVSSGTLDATLFGFAKVSGGDLCRDDGCHVFYLSRQPPYPSFIVS